MGLRSHSTNHVCGNNPFQIQGTLKDGLVSTQREVVHLRPSRICLSEPGKESRQFPLVNVIPSSYRLEIRYLGVFKAKILWRLRNHSVLTSENAGRLWLFEVTGSLEKEEWNKSPLFLFLKLQWRSMVISVTLNLKCPTDWSSQLEFWLTHGIIWHLCSRRSKSSQRHWGFKATQRNTFNYTD